MSGSSVNSFAREFRNLTWGDALKLCAQTTCILHSPDGQIKAMHSVSARLDYPGVGSEHSWLKDSGRAEYVAANDDEALRV